MPIIDCSNYAPGLTLTDFMSRSNLVPLAYKSMGKVKNFNFARTVADFDLKVGS